MVTGASSKLPLAGDASESDGFYLLKKDSQRRTTLDKVLCHDVTKICELWLTKIEPDANQELAITRDHLEMLLNGLRRYIAQQRTDVLEQVIAQLQLQPNFNTTANVQLHLALYAFQNTVITVLRSHNIKPHWMFALENLVKSAVHAGITILSPKLGANLAGNAPNDEEYDEETNDITTTTTATTAVLQPGHGPRVVVGGQDYVDHYVPDYPDYPDTEPVDGADITDEMDRYLAGSSTAGRCNVSRSNKPRARAHDADGADTTVPLQKRLRWKTLHEQLDALREEVTRLKEYLLESQQSYQSACRAVLESGAFARCLTDQLVALMERCLYEQQRASDGHISTTTTTTTATNSNNDNRGDEPEGEGIGPRDDDGEEDGSDRRLAGWLQTQGITRPESMRRILRERFRYDDFLYELERADLRRLGLRLGEELRIWNALRKHRRLHPPKRTHTDDDDDDGDGDNDGDGDDGDEVEEVLRHQYHRQRHNNCLNEDERTAGGGPIDAR